jgi:predicted DNA-binding transcriptional regulator AlpA
MERIRYLTARQARELTSLSERQMGRLAERGQFPQPVKLFEASRPRWGYVESEILDWNRSRLAASRHFSSSEGEAA